MKPENHHKIKSNARADARVKLHLRNQLGWLWGFPCRSADGKLGWRSVYFPGAWHDTWLPIDGSLISSTVYNRNKLVKDYPNALPRLVGDVAAWSKHIELKTHTVRALFAGNTTEVPDPWSAFIAPIAPARLVKYATTLKKQLPDRADTIDQFGWWLSGDLEALEQALQWLEQEAMSLSAIRQAQASAPDINILLPQLFYLHQQAGSKRCESLLALLESNRWKAAYLGSFNLEKLYRQKIKVLPESVDMSPIIHAWINTRVQLSKRDIRQHLDALNFLLPLHGIAHQEACWRLLDEVPRLFKETLREPTPWSHAASKAESEALFDAHVAQIKAFRIPVFTPDALQQTLLWLGEHPEWLTALQNLHHALNPSQLPSESIWNTPALTLFIGLHWHEHYNDCSGPCLKTVLARLQQFTLFIHAEGCAEQRLKRLPFMKKLVYPAQYKNYNLLDRALYSEQPDTLTHFTLLAEQPDTVITESNASALLYSYANIPTDERPSMAVFAQYLQVLEASNIYGGDFYQEWTWLHALAQGDPQQLISGMQSWGHFSETNGHTEWAEDDAETLTAAAYLYNQRMGYIADYAAAQNDLSALKRCGQLINTFKKIKLIPPVPRTDWSVSQSANQDQHWQQHYPEALQNALSYLSNLHPQAQKTAEKLLTRYLPPPHKLATEIQALQQKIHAYQQAGRDTHALQTRLDNQLARQHNPARLSPALIEKLTDKLTHAGCQGLLNHWQHTLHALLQDKVRHAFGLDELPAESLGQPRHLNTLIALLDLPAPTRAVAKKLLHTRLGEPPWDLRDEPANLSFRQRLKQLGVDETPWIAGLGHLQYTDEHPQELGQENSNTVFPPITLSLAFEDDPLEIFHMGNHFQTCLSAFNFNFFSVIANAADINKRVIYLRDEQQNIVGRCLFALSDDGHLLTFHPYSHLKTDSVKKALDDCANKLAAAMHTLRSAKGHISPRIASAWYDDGAQLYQAPVLEFVKNSALRKQLLSLPEHQATGYFDTLLEQYERVLKPLVILSLLRLPEFKQRPALSVGLLGAVKTLRNPDREISLKMAEYLCAAGHSHLALYILKNWRLHYRHVHKNDEYVYEIPQAEIKLLIAVSPSLAYRVLMNTRNAALNDEDDYDGRRLFYLGQIHEALNRPRRARVCYQAAIAQSVPHDLYVIAQERRDALAEAGSTP